MKFVVVCNCVSKPVNIQVIYSEEGCVYTFEQLQTLFTQAVRDGDLLLASLIKSQMLTYNQNCNKFVSRINAKL